MKLMVKTGLGHYAAEKIIDVDRETKCYWFSFPYKISKKTEKDIFGGLRVIEVMQ